MIFRILLLPFASLVAGMSYLVGLGRLMTGVLLGFSALGALFFGVLFSLPVNPERLWFPVYEPVPAWPYFLLAATLLILTLVHFFRRHMSARPEEVGGNHFRFLAGGLAGYVISLFASSVYWFPSDERRLTATPETLQLEVLWGAVFFLVGVSGSCYLLWRGSRGGNAKQPDLMRRFVLAVFTVFQLDKMPLLVAYLLVYAPETGVIFPNIAALALSAAIPVGLFLMKTTNDAQNP